MIASFGPIKTMATLWIVVRSSSALVRPTTFRTARSFVSKTTTVLASSFTQTDVEACVSRLGLLQTLLQKHGAPGSKACTAEDDLIPINTETPELVASLAGPQEDEFANLHPFLYPIAKSSSTGNVICAYRNPLVETSEKNHRWPIVESKVGAPGMQVLALTSEHLMRRIICECDFEGKSEDLIRLYNEGLGQGMISDEKLDAPYETGSVAKLGYGVDKYVLLRVGPFSDIYATMAQVHAGKNDEQSSLIAAEAANTKIPGFGSNFRFYARMLTTFPNRIEETRDAARMCLRLPLPTIGMELEDFKEVSVLGLMAEESDSTEVAIEKMKELYLKMREVERDDEPSEGMTEEQVAVDEANRVADMAALEGKEWSSIRKELSAIFRSVNREDMAVFIDR